MALYTKALRQRIIEDFARRNNLVTFDPALFLQEVCETGPSHPAYEWFEWDDTKAAHSYRIEQARAFGRDIRVVSTIETIDRNEHIKVREVVTPFIQSPISGRQDGGGYYFFNVNNPEHMAELCRQGAVALRAWLNRYSAALAHVQFSDKQFEKAIGLLEASAVQPVGDAAE